jgi:serpin B
MVSNLINSVNWQRVYSSFTHLLIQSQQHKRVVIASALAAFAYVGYHYHVKRQRALAIKSRPLDSPETSFARAVNRFALNLFARCLQTKKGQNFLFFTPTLLSNLFMLHTGASPKIKADIEKELGDQPQEEAMNLGQSFRNWVEKMTPVEGRSSVLSVKQLYILKNGYHLISSIAEIFKNIYQATSLAFDSAKEAEQKANEWISQETQGKITHLVQDLNVDTILILISAAVFNGKWLYSFASGNTIKDDFCNSDGTYVSVDMMHQYSSLCRAGYTREGIRILKLPLKDDLTMLIILPSEHKQNYTKQLEEYMQTEKLEPLISNLDDSLGTQSLLNIAIPKFKADSTINLLEDFPEWGLMQKIKAANFQSSFLQKSGGHPLKVQKMITRTQIELDEEGVSFQSVTYTSCYRESCPPQPFKVDRPFGLVLFDHKSRTILGMGRILEMPGTKSQEPQHRTKRRRY